MDCGKWRVFSQLLVALLLCLHFLELVQHTLQHHSHQLKHLSTGPTLNHPPAQNANLSSVERAAIEAERVKLDRQAAEKEWAEYLAGGLSQSRMVLILFASGM